MSWTDAKSIDTINQIKYRYNINTFFETGTFKGINAELHSSNFDKVITCESNKSFYNEAKRRLKPYGNIKIVHKDSKLAIKSFRESYKQAKREDIVIFYLDAHFFNPEARKEEKWVVKQELKALKGFRNSVVIIHDFAVNGLGHCCYNGECLDWKVIGKDLMRVNPDFKLYVNDRGLCNIVSEDDFKGLNLKRDFETLDNIRYANSSERLRYRGIIYALPTEMEVGLNGFKP